MPSAANERPTKVGKLPYARWRSRLRDLPEFGGELPVATLAEEMDTPGDGQYRGLVTIAGNPVLSTPNGARPCFSIRSKRASPSRPEICGLNVQIDPSGHHVFDAGVLKPLLRFWNARTVALHRLGEAFIVNLGHSVPLKLCICRSD